MNNEMHKAIKLLNEHSLSVVSTERQIENGTIMVMDDVLGDKYTIHSSGYARIRVAGWMGELAHYQLNKVTPRHEITHNYGGETFSYMGTKRILLPGEYVELAKMVIKKANRLRIKELELDK